LAEFILLIYFPENGLMKNLDRKDLTTFLQINQRSSSKAMKEYNNAKAGLLTHSIDKLPSQRSLFSGY